MQTEQFATSDISALREELQQSGLDNWQAAELISAFLVARGYGVSNVEARTAATRMDGCTIEQIQRELEGLALVM